MKRTLGCFGWLMVIIMGIPLLVLVAPLALVISIFAWWYFNKKGNDKYVTAAQLSTVISALGTAFFIYAINSPTEPETATTLVEQSSSIEQVDKQPEETTEEFEEQTVEAGEEFSEEETVIEEEPESTKEEKTEELEETAEVKEKPEPISSEDEGILSPELTLSLMESSFEGIANVTYSSEDKAFLIEPTDQEIKTALILLQEGSTPEINASWESLKDSFVSASNTIKDTVGEGYQIHMLNPTNNENTLLVVMDGAVMYDAFSQ